MKADWNSNGRQVLRPASRAFYLATIAAISALAAALILMASADRASAAFNNAPIIDFKTSTSQAAAHPDAQLTVVNPVGNQDIRSMKLSLPTGFWGSIKAATKCTDFQPGEASTGQDNCTGASKIGTVQASALIDESTVRLDGEVFLTHAFNVGDADEDQAGIGIKIPAKIGGVGGVDLGDVRIAARVVVRGNGQGIDTIVENIPNSIDDTANGHGVSNFHMTRVVVDLKTDLSSPDPFLTNPSSCPTSPAQATGKFSTSTTYVDGAATSAAPIDYPVTGCDNVSFDPAISYSIANPTAGGTTGLTTDISVPFGSATLSQINVAFPSSFGANYPAFGSMSTAPDRDMCESGTAPNNSTFNPTPADCPESAKIGSVALTTPLIDGTINGDVYLIEKIPLPWLGIDINPSISGNPKGITLRMVGTTLLPFLDPACDDNLIFCQSRITASFANIPDAPVSDIELDLNKPDRQKNNGLGTLSSKMLTVASASQCQAADEITTTVTSSANSFVPFNRVQAHRSETVNITGCDPAPIDVSSTAFGASLSTTDPFSATISTAGTFECGIDRFMSNPIIPEINTTPCTGSYAPGLQLEGAHRFFIGAASIFGAPQVSRGFAVNPADTPPESTAPDTTIDSGPTAGTTSDRTPEFAFSGTDNASAPGDLEFQCSVDGSAFLPCTSPYTFDELDADNTTDHTFAVRARDEAGNTDLSPAEGTFKVDVPFNAAFAASVSTTQARANPSFNVTITNDSHNDLKSVNLSLPDGFFGALSGVARICPLAVADAGGCTAASKIGTVRTTATVDKSTVVIGGDVFMTDPRVAGDPASLSIRIRAKVGGVDLGNVIVNGLLKVRAGAKGIDGVVLSIPNSITKFNSAISANETIEFDARKLEMTLTNNSMAAHPLLVNPSSCGPAAFSASMGSYGPVTSTSGSSPLQVTGCDALGFSPKLDAQITEFGKSTPPGNSSARNPVSATLDATLTANPGDAGISGASLLLPKPVTINVLNIPPVCEDAQYQLDACPPVSRVGTAVAYSPLLRAPLHGTIYLVRAVAPGIVTPRMGINLRGPINLNVIMDNRFEPGTQTQIRTTIADLPDVPINKFELHIERVVSTLNEACDTPADKWSILGSFNAFNGKSAPQDAPLNFDCTGVAYKYRYKSRKGNGSELTIAAKAQGKQPSLRRVKIQLPKRELKLNKRLLRRKLQVRVNGRRISSRKYRRCVKPRGSRVVFITSCGKRGETIEAKFKKGALKRSKKALRRPKMRITVLDSAKKKKSRLLSMRSGGFRSFRIP